MPSYMLDNVDVHFCSRNAFLKTYKIRHDVSLMVISQEELCCYLSTFELRYEAFD